jgi:hypothetical protein
MIVIAAMVTHSPIVEAMNDRKFPHWDGFHVTHTAESMPWFYPGIDPDLAPAIERACGLWPCARPRPGPGTRGPRRASLRRDRDPTCLLPPCAAVCCRRRPPDRQDASFLRFGLPDPLAGR